MRNCKKCHVEIPVRMLIDNKYRNLQRRKFCLTCSPFGQHNTMSVLRPTKGILSICSVCDRQYIWIKNKGGTTKKCNSCWTKERRDRLKAIYLEKLGGKCQNCGYDKCQQALCFHHVDPNTKLFEISSAYNKKQSIVSQEVDKCILLCSNCHIELHYK